MQIHVQQRGEDDFKYSVTIRGKTFENVETIDCSAKKCKHYKNGSCLYNLSPHGVVRHFDCPKKAKNVTRLYNWVTGMIVIFFVLNMFRVENLSIFKSIGYTILFLVAFDMFCTFIEWMISAIRDNLFYRKQSRIERKRMKAERKQREEEERKREEEELKKRAQNPYYADIEKASNFMIGLQKISDDVIFGPCDKKVAECVDKLNEILNVLKDDGSGYNRVAFLFEVYLPEFYNTLKHYADFVNAKAVITEYDKTLTECVNKFYDFLNEQRIEAVLDKKSTEIQFNTTAKTLIDLIDDGGNING